MYHHPQVESWNRKFIRPFNATDGHGYGFAIKTITADGLCDSNASTEKIIVA